MGAITGWEIRAGNICVDSLFAWLSEDGIELNLENPAYWKPVCVPVESKQYHPTADQCDDSPATNKKLAEKWQLGGQLTFEDILFLRNQVYETLKWRTNVHTSTQECKYKNKVIKVRRSCQSREI